MTNQTDTTVFIGFIVLTILGAILTFTTNNERVFAISPDIFGAGLGGAFASGIILIRRIFK